METKAKLVCSICRNPIEPDRITGWAKGNNAQPINDGRCCNYCNATVVLPVRISRIRSNDHA